MNAHSSNSISPLLQKLGYIGRRTVESAQRSIQEPALELTPKRGLLLLYFIIVSLVAWTWCATADILVDFGRELYVPWQIAEGKTLYQDIAYFNGPLSPHFNAMVFQLTGASVAALVVVNTIILAALVTTLYWTLLRHFSVVASTIACVCMVILFGIAHKNWQGNYNYITPYSHELTHGLLLAFIILALLKFDEKFKLWKWSLIGVLWGLVFLGKGELFLAATAMLACALLLPLCNKKLPLRQVLARLGTAAVFATLPVAAFWLLLCRQTNVAQASLNVLGTWRYIFASDVTSLFFYRHMAGLTNPFWNAVVTVCHGLATACVLFGLWAWARNFGGRGWRNPVSAMAIMPGLFLGGFSAFVLHERVFFVIAVILCLSLLWLAFRRREDFCKYHHLACWAVFAVCIMFKIALRPMFFFYGFALTMPVCVLAIAVATDWLPRLISHDGAGKRFRCALVALLALDATMIFARTVRYTHQKEHVIGSAADHLRCAGKRGVHLAAAAEYLGRRTRPDDTLLVLPEGISLNYLLRRENNSPYVNFMQPELVMYGEEHILTEFEADPSDYVLLVTRPVKDYKLNHFGQPGYGDKIMKWVRANYEVEKQFGADPFDLKEFGVQILRRRPHRDMQVQFSSTGQSN